jgi:uncharacterized repeat protein (TIGR01451 family)
VVNAVPSVPVLYVDAANTAGSGDGSQANPFVSIQDAVNAAETGTVIRVAQGFYPENVLIAPSAGISLTLEGGWDSAFTNRSTDAALTVIDGGQTGAALAFNHTTADTGRLRLEGFTMTNGSGYEIYTNTFRGGGLYVSAVGGSYLDLEINNCAVNNNGRTSSSLLGNGAYITLNDGRVSISNSSFSNNYNSYYREDDAGLYLQAYGRGRMELTGNTVTSNNGRGIYLYADMMPVLLDGNLLEGNSLSGLSLHSGANRNVVLQGNSYSGNNGLNDWYNGGLEFSAYGNGRVTSRGETFVNGGNSGIYCGGGALVVENAIISGNSRYGIHNYDVCDLFVSDTQISGNGSSGIYIYNDEPGANRIRIDSSRIVDNGGDGIYLEPYYYEVLRQTLEVVNSVISGNGDGIYIESDDYYGNQQFIDVSVIHSTITGNSSDGIDMWTSDQPPMRLNVLNSIVRDNTYDDIYNDEMKVFIGHTDYSVYSGSGFLTDLGGNIDVEPLLNADFHLLETSPCIDAGADLWMVSADIDGQDRPYYTGPDIGADEFLDLVPPVISLLGEDPVTVEAGASYVDAGATAADNIDGDVTGFIVTDNPVNENVPDIYTVTYDVTDTSGNAATQVTRTVNVVDTTPPVLTVPSLVSAEATGPLTDVDLGAATANDLVDGPLTPVPDNSGPYPVGITTVTWSVTDSHNNSVTATQQVTVTDSTAPVLIVPGVVSAEATGPLTDVSLGTATAADLVDGTLVPTADNPGPYPVGTTTVTWSVTDSHNNSVTATQQVTVTDTISPVITLVGDDPVTVEVNSSYEDAGATAADTVDGDLTAGIVTVDPVDITTPGIYTITYNVKDTAGNAATQVTRTVNVISAEINFARSSMEVDESDGTITIDLALTAPLLSDVTVGVQLSGSATEEADFTFVGDRQILFGPGAVTASIQVDLSDDAIDEEMETVVIDLVNPSSNAALGMTGRFVLNILDNDTAGIVVSEVYSGTALQFDGVDDYVVVPDAPALDLTSEMTLSGWFYYQGGVSYDDALVQKDGPGSWGRYGLWLQNDQVGFCVYPDGGSQQCVVSTQTLAVDGWYHVAGVYDGVNMFLYLNGSLDNSLPLSGAISTSAENFYIGADPTDSLYTPVTLDEVRLWNIALDERTIQDWQHRQVTPDHPYYGNLAGYWPFDEGPGSAIAADHSGNGNDGILTNMDVNPSWVTSAALTGVVPEGEEASYDIVLTSEPVAEVIITLMPDSRLSTGSASLSFSASDWYVPQIVTVTPVDDGFYEGLHTGSLVQSVSSADSNYDNYLLADVVIDIIDFDTEPPLITLLGSNPVTVEAGSSYVDAGATAMDNADGDLTAGIVTVNPVDVHVLGEYTITYDVYDSSGNAAEQVTRTVRVVDTTKPVISLLGDNPVEIIAGTAYLDAGATASDDYDGDISSAIKVENNVDANTPGDYTVTYNVSDSSGNDAQQVERLVIVLPQPVDLVLLKTTTTAFVDPGGMVEYIITVTNNGPGFAENVTVTDTLQQSVSNAEFSLDNGSSWNSWTGSVNLGTLPAGNSIQFKLRGTVADNSTGRLITNTATVSSDQIDNDGSNNSSSQQSLVRAENIPPVPVSPVNGTILEPGTYPVVLESSPFVDPDGHTHLETHWRVRRADMGYGHEDLPDSFNVTVISGDMTHHFIDSGLFEGLQYVWQVGYVDSGNDKVFWSQESSFSIGTKSTSDTEIVSGGEDVRSYRMVSIDYWPEDANCMSVFDLTTYDTTRYRIGTYDPLTGTYLECTDGLQVEPGRSYWVLAREGIDITVEGVAVTTSSDVSVKLQYSDTGTGWNMIGVPNGRDYLWDDVEVVQYGEDGNIINGPFSLNDPNAALLIDTQVWAWENGSYNSHSPGEEPSYKLVHRRGYWVQALQKGVSLVFTVDAQLADSSSISLWLVSVKHSTRRWLQKWVFASVAHADAGDAPPLPMGGLGSTVKGTSVAEGGGGGCFIATAAYGSYMEPHVEILKDFRDRILLPTRAGKQFVRMYYEYSPPLADFIAEHDTLRVVVRVALLPLVAISSLCLSFGLVPVMISALGLSVIMLLSLCSGRYFPGRKRVE